MPIGIRRVDHVQVTVPREREAEAKDFYADVLGLTEIPKPADARARGGAWFAHGAMQIHVSIEDVPVDANRAS